MNENLQIGNGFRGCRPEEFALYDPTKVKLVCQACDFPWDMDLWDFELDPPVQCPVCDERWIDGNYIRHDMQLYELRRIHRLAERQIDVELIPGSGLAWGADGVYKLTIHPYDYTPIVGSYTHNVPSNEVAYVWQVPHNLGTSKVKVTCYDSSGGIIDDFGVNHIDENVLNIAFSLATSGSCLVETLVSTGHPFVRRVFLTDPDDLTNNAEFNNDMLQIEIDNQRPWKRAYIYIYRVIDAIQDF